MIKEKCRIDMELSIYDLDIIIERHNKEKTVDKIYDTIQDMLEKFFPDTECTFSFSVESLKSKSNI